VFKPVVGAILFVVFFPVFWIAAVNQLFGMRVPVNLLNWFCVWIVFFPAIVIGAGIDQAQNRRG